MPLTLADVFSQLQWASQWVNASHALPPSTPLTGVVCDTRHLTQGCLFVALTGTKTDSHTLLRQAFEAGANVAVIQGDRAGVIATDVLEGFPLISTTSTYRAYAELVSAWHGHPAQHLRMVGVTGTNGKTTVSHLIERLLADNGIPTGLIGTLGSRLAKPEAAPQTTYDATNNTTPMADVLQTRLATMHADGAKAVVMEVSSHALDQHRTAGCAFEVAVVTNLTQDHLDYHGTMDRYFAAKAKLLVGLEAGASAILNADDAYVDRFKAAVPQGVKVLTFGLVSDRRPSVLATEITYGMQGTTCTVTYPAVGNHPAGSLPLNLQLAGEFGLYNALAAFAAGLALGLSPQQVQTALQATPAVRGRFEVVSQAPAVVVDYAHTPDGLDNVLRAARKVLPEGGKLWAVFGCGGDRDATKRPKMGAIAERLADALVVTSDNPRTEDPQQILADILAGISSLEAKPVKVEADRRQAIRLAVTQALPNDVVVIAGKGHEDYQILADRTIHFDDKEEALAAVALRGSAPEVARLG